MPFSSFSFCLNNNKRTYSLVNVRHKKYIIMGYKERVFLVMHHLLRPFSVTFRYISIGKSTCINWQYIIQYQVKRCDIVQFATKVLVRGGFSKHTWHSITSHYDSSTQVTSLYGTSNLLHAWFTRKKSLNSFFLFVYASGILIIATIFLHSLRALMMSELTLNKQSDHHHGKT